MNQVFRTQKTLKFREADPAGIMFFGNIFAFAHDAFEEFIVTTGYTYEEWFGQKDVIIPIRQTESNFLSPFYPGQTYDVAVTIASFGETSFKMKYVFSQKDKTHAIVTMVHAVVDSKTMQKSSLPFTLKSRLEPFLESTGQGC
ncbi:acyl-CoA thioesterase [Bdellovibrio sp.]|uniref:acyl-CoA thioesterase n=1 Tax=Bdellovibrio sp. TaxID=28201 RepID=UPI0039E4AF26